MTDVTSRPTERERWTALIIEQSVELDRLKRSNAVLLEACKAIEYWLSDLHPDNLPCCFPRERLRAAIKEAENG